MDKPCFKEGALVEITNASLRDIDGKSVYLKRGILKSWASWNVTEGGRLRDPFVEIEPEDKSIKNRYFYIRDLSVVGGDCSRAGKN